MKTISNFNDALDAAVNKEINAVKFYEKAMNIVNYPGAKDMIEDFVKEEKRHVQLLKAAKESREMQNVGKKSLPPDLELTKFLVDVAITETSTPQEVMIAAMKNEESAIALYAQKVKAFKGTELESVFHELMQMEKEHKEHLENEYERNFMPDN